jgi:hypothetical protein
MKKMKKTVRISREITLADISWQKEIEEKYPELFNMDMVHIQKVIIKDDKEINQE